MFALRPVLGLMRAQIEQLPAGSISQNLSGFGFEKPAQGITTNWLTPPKLLQQLGTFDLDPCGCAGMPWRTATTTYFLPEHNGLVEPWFGRVWCNPPYGSREVVPWLKRMAQHGNGFLLIYARSETLAWQRDVFPHADGTLFLAGRLHLYRASGERGESATAPSSSSFRGMAQPVSAYRGCWQYTIRAAISSIVAM